MPAGEAAAGRDTTLKGRVVLARYRVVRPLASGGMGVVYLGRVEGAAGFAKPVVIKSVLASFSGDPEREQLFAREARIVSNLQHPGIVGVIDFGKVDDTYVMVLEYVHGYHLGQWLRYVKEARGRMSVAHALHVVLLVLDALSFAHSVARPDGTMLGVVHRDISPANVLVDLQGHVKLSDFGIARTDDDDYKTQQGMFRGTLLYAPPEAFAGARPNARFDQYAAALVLYQLLSGANPFKATETAETIVRILNLVPPPLAAARDDVPRAIDEAVMRALDKDPEQRFASVKEFADALRAGVTWSEHEAEVSFAAQINRDFSGDALPAALGIESLAVRDAAWRDAQELLEAPIALSSSPPRVASAPPSITTVRLGTEREAGAAEPRPASTTREAKGRRVSGIVIGSIASASAVAVALVVALRPAAQPVDRMLVIEKQQETGADTAPAAPASVSAEPSSAPVPAASAPSTTAAPLVGHPAPASPGASADRGADLARAFQRRGAEIQRCFRQPGAGVEGQPAISVRFQVDASGAVQRAQVIPTSVAGTPAGACLLAVAQSTRFGAQNGPVSFSIPISTRVVRR